MHNVTNLEELYCAHRDGDQENKQHRHVKDARGSPVVLLLRLLALLGTVPLQHRHDQL